MADKGRKTPAGDEGRRRSVGLRYVGDGTVAVVDGQQVPPRNLTAGEVERFGGVAAILAVIYAGKPLYESMEVNDDGGK